MVRKKSIPKRCQGANTSLTMIERRAALVLFLKEQEEQIIAIRKVAKEEHDGYNNNRAIEKNTNGHGYDKATIMKFGHQIKDCVIMHTNNSAHICYICNRAYTSASTLQRHKRIHTGEKPYKCFICSKAFSESGALARHKRLHTGEKAYNCSDCAKAFSESGALTKHVRKHTGEKLYKCEVCKKTFAHSSHVKRHMKTHNVR